MARSSRWDTHVKPNLDKIAHWARYETETQIYTRLGVSWTTWDRYKKQYPELQKALLSKQDLISDVRNALLKRALGFYYEETKTTTRKDESTGNDITTVETTRKYAAPDVGACNSILQNMAEGWYRDKAQYELKKQELELKKKQIEQNEF